MVFSLESIRDFKATPYKETESANVGFGAKIAGILSLYGYVRGGNFIFTAPYTPYTPYKHVKKCPSILISLYGFLACLPRTPRTSISRTRESTYIFKGARV